MKLEVRNLSFSYNEKQVLKGISFGLEKGDFLSVLGPNGVGKTTLFKCILGILENYQGEILSEGQNIRRLSPAKMAELIAYIPQISRPAFGYTVLDTVLMSTAHRRSPFSAPKKADVDCAREALERLGVLRLEDRNFAYLSGGEQQLVLVARALAQQSGILVMDEPTASLDYGNQYRVLEKVKKLSQDGYTVLLSTHTPQQALSFSNRVLALQGGEVAAFGDTVKCLTPELVEKLYGIRVEYLKNEHGCAMMPLYFT